MNGCPMCGSAMAPLKSLTAPDLLSRVANIPYGLANIVVTISAAEGYDYTEVRRDRGKAHLVKVRDKIILRARSRGYSYPQIGRSLNRDHSTIINRFRRGLIG